MLLAISKYWYEKGRSKECTESIYNLGQLSLKLNDNHEAEKYYNEGFKLGNKKCEYMLAGIYFKKSMDMYKSLADENYEDSVDIVKSMPNLNINFDEVLIAPFELNEEKNDDEEYVPDYILEKQENIEDMFEGLIEDMIIEE